MQYYIRSNAHTLGPFAEDQVLNLLEQGRFDDSVELSTDLEQWFPPEECSAFAGYLARHPLARSAGGKTIKNQHPHVQPQKKKFSVKSENKDHSVFYFLSFCVLIFTGLGTALYLINKSDDDVATGSGTVAGTTTTVNIGTSDALPNVYEKHKKAVGLVTITFQIPNGNQETVPIGTAFAISPKRFVTNAHVAYAVKNGFEENLVMPILQQWVIKEAKDKRKSVEAFIEEIGERGLEQRRNTILEKWKSLGIKIRDIEIRLNHSNGKSFRVAKVQVHPNYKPNGKETGEYDVAVFEIEGATDCYFQTASKGELHALRAGIPVASAGFPMEGLQNGDLNLEKPEASYASGDIKKVTDFDNKDGGIDNNRSITHSIPAAGGASGSPIFIGNGNVVAVLWGVHHMARTSQGRVPSGLLHNRAVRIDQIENLGRLIPWEEWVNDPTRTITYTPRSNYSEPVRPASVTPPASQQRVEQRSDVAQAREEYNRIVSELSVRNKKLAEALNAYDAVKVLIGLAMLASNPSPQQISELNQKMKEIDLAIEQEKAALARLNARKEELRVRYNF